MRRRWLNWDGVRTALQTPTVGLLILAFFLSIVGFSQFQATLSLLNMDNLKLPNTQNFLMFAYVGLVLMLVQGLSSIAGWPTACARRRSCRWASSSRASVARVWAVLPGWHSSPTIYLNRTTLTQPCWRPCWSAWRSPSPGPPL
jgi:hypothetical protein